MICVDCKEEFDFPEYRHPHITEKLEHGYHIYPNTTVLVPCCPFCGEPIYPSCKETITEEEK